MSNTLCEQVDTEAGRDAAWPLRTGTSGSGGQNATEAHLLPVEP